MLTQEDTQKLQNLHDKLAEINKVLLKKQDDKTPVTVQGFLIEGVLAEMREILIKSS